MLFYIFFVSESHKKAKPNNVVLKILSLILAKIVLLDVNHQKGVTCINQSIKLYLHSNFKTSNQRKKQ